MKERLDARNEDVGKLTYISAGVDIEAASKAKDLIKKQASITSRPEVLSNIGLFGGLFELQGYSQPVLVSSTDGVGTKLKIASTLGKCDTIRSPAKMVSFSGTYIHSASSVSPRAG